MLKTLAKDFASGESGEDLVNSWPIDPQFISSRLSGYHMKTDVK